MKFGSGWLHKTALLSVAISLLSDVSLGAVAESRFWQERRTTLAERSSTVLASLPASLPPTAPVPPPPWLDLKRPSLSTPVASLLASIPLTHATVRQVSDPPGAKAAPVVVLEDVHLNPEAQSNLAVILQSLIEGGAVGVVGLEGAFDPVSFRPLRLLRRPDNGAALTRVARSFLEESALGAPSYVGLASPREPPPFVGVDDRTGYRANVVAYLVSQERRPATERLLSAAVHEIDAEKAGAFSPRLKEFDALCAAYRREQIPLGVYVRGLCAAGVPATPLVRRFLDAYDAESSLDFREAERQRREIIERLVGKLSPDETTALMGWSVAQRTGRMSVGRFYAAFRELCEKKGIPLSSTPAFDKYLRYVTVADGIDGGRLLADVSDLESAVFRSLTRTPEELRLERQSRRAFFLGKLLAFSLTPNEWAAFSSDKSRLTAELKALDARIAPFRSFYVRAEERSRVMVDRLLREKSATGRVLVAGGFHTPEVAALLNARGVPCIVVSPKLSKVDMTNASGYLSVFERENTPLDELFRGERLFINPSTVIVNDKSLLLRLFASTWYALTGKDTITFRWKGASYRLRVTPADAPGRNSFRLSEVVGPEWSALMLIPLASAVGGMGLPLLFGVPAPVLVAWIASAILIATLGKGDWRWRFLAALGIGAFLVLPAGLGQGGALMGMAMAVPPGGRSQPTALSDSYIAPDLAVARSALAPMIAGKPEAADKIERALEEMAAALRPTSVSAGTLLRVVVPALVKMSPGDPDLFVRRLSDLTRVFASGNPITTETNTVMYNLAALPELLSRHPELWAQAIQELDGWKPEDPPPLSNLLLRSLIEERGELSGSDLLYRANRAGSSLPRRNVGDGVLAFDLREGRPMDSVPAWEQAGVGRFLVATEGTMVLTRVRNDVPTLIYSPGHHTCWSLDIRGTDAAGNEWVGHAHIFVPRGDFDWPGNVQNQIDQVMRRLSEAGIVSARMELGINLNTFSLNYFASETDRAAVAEAVRDVPEYARKREAAQRIAQVALRNAVRAIENNDRGIAVQMGEPITTKESSDYLDTATTAEKVTFGYHRGMGQYFATERRWPPAERPEQAARSDVAPRPEAKPYSLRDNWVAVLATGIAVGAALGFGVDPTSHWVIALYSFAALVIVHLAAGVWVRRLDGGSDSPFLVTLAALYFGPAVEVRFRSTAEMSRPDYLEETDVDAGTVTLHRGWVRASRNPLLNLLRLLIFPIVLAHAGSRLWRLPTPLIYLLKPVQLLYAPLKLLLKWLLRRPRGLLEEQQPTIFDHDDESAFPNENDTVVREEAPPAPQDDARPYVPEIAKDPDPALEVAVVIPILNEYRNGNIFQLLESFANQNADPKTFELIFVINNLRDDAQQRTEAYLDNRASVDLVAYLNSPPGTPLPESLAREPREHRDVVERLRERGIAVHVIDRTGGVDRNMGIIRSLGVNEAIHRLYGIGKPDGWIASLDGDTVVPPDYISRLRAHLPQSSIDGLFTNLSFDFRGGGEFMFRSFFHFWLRRAIVQLGGSLSAPRPTAAGGPQIVARARLFADLGSFGEMAKGEDGRFAQLAGSFHHIFFADDIDVRVENRARAEGFDAAARLTVVRAAESDPTRVQTYYETINMPSIRFRLLASELRTYNLAHGNLALSPEIRALLEFYGVPIDERAWKLEMRGDDTFTELEEYFNWLPLNHGMRPQEAVEDFVDNVLRPRMPASAERWDRSLREAIERERSDMAQVQQGVRLLIEQVRNHPDADPVALVGDHGNSVLRTIVREPWFVQRIRFAADAAEFPTLDEAYESVATVFPDWLRPFEQTPIRRDLVYLRAFEAFMAQGRHKPSLDPQLHGFLRRFGGNDIVVLDGYQLPGGVLEWLRALLFPNMSPAAYGRRAFFIENALFTVMVGPPILLGALLGGVDLTTAFRIANAATWLSFIAAHFPPLVRLFGGRSPTWTNVGYAALIGTANLALGFVPLTGPLLGLVLVLSALATHFAVNKFAQRRPLRPDETRRLALRLALYVKEGNVAAALADLGEVEPIFRAVGNASWSDAMPLLAAELRRQIRAQPTDAQRRRLAELLAILPLALTRDELTSFVSSIDDLVSTRVKTNESILFLIDPADPRGAVTQARALVDRLERNGELRDGNHVALVIPKGHAEARDALRADPVLRRWIDRQRIQVVERDISSTLTTLLLTIEQSPGWDRLTTVRVVMKEGTDLPANFFDLPATDPRKVILDIILISLPGVAEVEGGLIREFQGLRAALIAA